MRYEGPVRYNSGEVHNFRVRLVSRGGLSKPSEVLNTGRGFEALIDAELYAHGMYAALRTALVDTGLEYLGFPEELRAGAENA
jgi:hypothetical protein